MGKYLLLGQQSRSSTKIEPKAETGTEIINQIKTMATKVPKGTAPDDLAAIKNIFNPVNMDKIPIGTSSGVKIKFNFQSSPPKNL
ncbi:hypothetical protein WICMUC_005761 [Wickerhamomyces mucosus]|uniref:Uncharacterized protein n=1 Tax=Wickerhamomyces mucosus TaxID=1378264 RepID=A0A9P8P3I0_9ASCO|nr:hypothetical protein WICMUC_005761 [Wickerhamomyces mucosus]